MSTDNKEIDISSYVEDAKYYELVLTLVKSKLNVCVLLSGPPGSGKTTIANKLMSDLENKATVSRFNTDSYFMKNSVYKFNRFMLGRYHDKCKAAFRESKSNVKIVDNTNLTKAERKPYIEHATETGYINIVIYMNITNEGTIWNDAELNNTDCNLVGDFYILNENGVWNSTGKPTGGVTYACSVLYQGYY